MASNNKTDIEKLEELADRIEREHEEELQELRECYKTNLQNAREARDIAIKEASKLRNDVNLAKDLVHDFRSDIAIMLGISCDGMADDVQDAIDSELDKRLMPPGMEWPRFEDGAMVVSGDKVMGDDGDDSAHTVWTIRFCKNSGWAYRLNDEYDRPIHTSWMPCTHRVKRPEQDVIGADGLPIKVGETMYGIGREQDVYAVVSTRANDQQGRFSVECEDGTGEKCMVDPSQLTHTTPDTQWRINADAMLRPKEYCRKHSCPPCGHVRGKWRCAMMANILRRQRELDARTMGGDAS